MIFNLTRLITCFCSPDPCAANCNKIGGKKVKLRKKSLGLLKNKILRYFYNLCMQSKQIILDCPSWQTFFLEIAK